MRSYGLLATSVKVGPSCYVRESASLRTWLLASVCRRAAAAAPRVPLGKPCVVGTGFPEHGVKGVSTHSLFLDPLHHCHGFFVFIRFHKIRLTCSNSAANRGNSEIHSLDEPAAQRSGTRQQNVFPSHSGRQASASTPSASPGFGQGRSRAFQLRPASPDLKRPRLLAA
jgi:hypothetical protein